MGLTCVIGEKGLVELDADDVGYECVLRLGWRDPC